MPGEVVPSLVRPLTDMTVASSPDLRHCVVFLGKTLNSPSAFLYSGVIMGTGESMLLGVPVILIWARIPFRREYKYS